MKNDKNWDEHQWQVITAGPTKRIVVEAGPGTGKTAVACRRLAQLINEEDLEPTRTWMISFTRTAVTEIINRLYDYVGDAYFGIKIATIDAHAWAIHSGYVSKAKLTGSYEENIEKVIKLIGQDEDVAEELGEIEHLVIDEAQDIVGVRAEFIETLVSKLSASCGVTIFVDEAQAIYNFSDETIGKKKGASVQPLRDRLESLKKSQFDTLELKTIHRTSDINLKKLFSTVLENILNPSFHEKGLHERISQSIKRLASENVDDDVKVNIHDYRADTLLLYRTRAEVLSASQFCDKKHRLRLSEFRATLPAWIAQIFWDCTDQSVSRSNFIELWMNRLPERVRQVKRAERRWEILEKLAGDKDGTIDIERLRKRLGQENPPEEIAIKEFGLSGGPIVGTIHASKGRESEYCVLFLPPSASFKDLEDEIEETKVMFVGATRGKTYLTTHSGFPSFRTGTLSSGRVFRNSKKDSTQVEIGRAGDILAEGLVGRMEHTKEKALNAQIFLAKVASRVSNYKLEADPKLDWNYRIKTEDSKLCVAVLSDAFKADIWGILSKKKQSDVRRPPRNVKYVKSLGSRTVVLDLESDEVLRKLHKPWSKSGIMLAPKIVSFPPFYYTWRV